LSVEDIRIAIHTHLSLQGLAAHIDDGQVRSVQAGIDLTVGIENTALSNLHWVVCHTSYKFIRRSVEEELYTGDPHNPLSNVANLHFIYHRLHAIRVSRLQFRTGAPIRQ
jgi:hypothetical protein